MHIKHKLSHDVDDPLEALPEAFNSELPFRPAPDLDHEVPFRVDRALMDLPCREHRRAQPMAAHRRNRQKRATAEDFPHIGNVALKPCLDFAGLSKATAYKYGLVPEYDDTGQLIETGKEPPFPWIRMPHSLVRNRKGKKLFIAEEIRVWLQIVRDRSRQIDNANTNNFIAPIKRGGI
jgi:hypothetical protein